MDIINLGAADGLPPVNWANVVEELEPDRGRLQTPTTLARRGCRR